MSRSRRHFSSCAGMAVWHAARPVGAGGRASASGPSGLSSLHHEITGRAAAGWRTRARAPAHAGSRTVGGWRGSAGRMRKPRDAIRTGTPLGLGADPRDSQAVVRSGGGLDATRRVMDPVSLSRAGCELRRRRRRASVLHVRPVDRRARVAWSAGRPDRARSLSRSRCGVFRRSRACTRANEHNRPDVSAVGVVWGLAGENLSGLSGQEWIVDGGPSAKPAPFFAADNKKKPCCVSSVAQCFSSVLVLVAAASSPKGRTTVFDEN